MPDPSHPFAHRVNPDGTTDAICKKCFATVGSSAQADHLESLELAHACDPWRMQAIQSGSRTNSSTKENSN